MNKIFLGICLLILTSSSVYAGSDPSLMQEQIDRAIQESDELIQKQNPDQKEPTQIIQQQQQILEGIDELEYFRSLDDAREILKKLNKKQQKYLK